MRNPKVNPFFLKCIRGFVQNPTYENHRLLVRVYGNRTGDTQQFFGCGIKGSCKSCPLGEFSSFRPLKYPVAYPYHCGLYHLSCEIDYLTTSEAHLLAIQVLAALEKE